MPVGDSHSLRRHPSPENLFHDCRNPLGGNSTLFIQIVRRQNFLCSAGVNHSRSRRPPIRCQPRPHAAGRHHRDAYAYWLQFIAQRFAQCV